MYVFTKVLDRDDNVVAFVNYEYWRFKPVALRPEHILALDLDQVFGFPDDQIELLCLRNGRWTQQDEPQGRGS